MDYSIYIETMGCQSNFYKMMYLSLKIVFILSPFPTELATVAQALSKLSS